MRPTFYICDIQSAAEVCTSHVLGGKDADTGHQKGHVKDRNVPFANGYIQTILSDYRTFAVILRAPNAFPLFHPTVHLLELHSPSAVGRALAPRTCLS